MSEPVLLRPIAIVRVIFGALTAGPPLVAGAMWFVLPDRLIISALAGPLGYGLYALCAAGLAFGVWWGRRIPVKSGGQDSDGYWRGVLLRVLALYALLEGVAVLGVLVSLLAGRTALTLLILGVYVMQMMLYSPGRLSGD